MYALHANTAIETVVEYTQTDRYIVYALTSEVTSYFGGTFLHS